MGARKITDEQMELAKIWFCKGLVPSDEIGERLSMSRQGVIAALKRMGVNTSKHQMIVKCSNCDMLISKTRANVRRCEEHFCSPDCVAKWIARPEVQAEKQRMSVARALCHERGLPAFALYAGKEIYAFDTKEQLMEWKRTGLPAIVWALGPHKKVEITYSQAKREEI